MCHKRDTRSAIFLKFYFQSGDNVQAVEDSGEGEGTEEQSDVTAGQSESTEGSEERGVGRAEAPDNEGHHGESHQSTVQAPADTNQQVSAVDLTIFLSYWFSLALKLILKPVKLQKLLQNDVTTTTVLKVFLRHFLLLFAILTFT